MNTTELVLHLQAAMLAHAKGELGERELIAVTMAVNEAIERSAGEPYAATAKQAAAAMLERVAELDQGEP